MNERSGRHRPPACAPWLEQAERPAAAPSSGGVARLPAVVRKQLARRRSRVLVLRDPSVPIVALRAAWVGGLRYETPGTTASATWLPPCSPAAPPAAAPSRSCTGWRAWPARCPASPAATAWASQAEFLARHLPEGLDLVADCLLNATFPQAEIDRERRVVLEDIRAQDDNLTHVAFRAFHEARVDAPPVPAGSAGHRAFRPRPGSPPACSRSTAVTTAPQP